ncbi:hypothetical protein C8J57DRAFT_1519836 [Mycena rebaudengoi]|nr:hypothetical protein C8J57DRAFT_1519836 [Mycena rebaudengoi]
MPNNIGEPSLVFASLISNRAVAVASLGASIVILAMIWMIPRIWPMRLTYISVAFMKETEKLYYDAVEAGELPHDVGIEEKLLSLQKKKALSDFFKGRSITLFQCMDEIQRFNTHLEILKETQMRTHLTSTNPGTAALAMSRKRRHNR